MQRVSFPLRAWGLAGGVVTVLLLAASAAAQEPAGSSDIQAVRTSHPPVIDGRLTEEEWTHAAVVSSFTQQDPDEGKPATERTEVRVLYDDDAVYVGLRLFDSDAAQIGGRLSPRDGDADADRVTIYLDPMHDHLTGASFRVSASNVQKDTIVFNDSWQDSTWDAVWESGVSVDEGGWSAEMRIPLSQLRFPSVQRQSWGFNVERFIRRKNETAWLRLVPKNETGLASRMPHLTGLDGLQPKSHLELLPYTAVRAEFIASESSGNPFNDGSRGFVAGGLDLKWGLTSNLTLNATINPDFGQVEVDPAVVNLTAFETFFQEKRPFFLEGAQIFTNFGQGGSNNFWGFNTSDPSIFYSRRIGRSPQLSASGDFTDEPSATTILGAAKLTGKTSHGWSLGFLEAVTGSETARTQSNLGRRRVEVEPLTNYSVLRAQRELGSRGGAGFMSTAVVRRLDTPELSDKLVNRAYVFGVDGYFFFDKAREWVVTGKLSGSRVQGSPAAVERLQRAAQRYYQRPDAPHLALDVHRTSLNGFSGRINLNRNSGLWQLNAALWGVSPGFESNDLGFHGTGDRAGAHTVVQWRDVTPDRVTRSKNVWLAKWWTWNFNRELQGDGWQTNGFMTFQNYWSLSAGAGLRRQVLDDRLTRGGPSATAPGGGFWNANLSTDSRQWFSVQANGNHNWTSAGGWNNNASVTVSLKPSSRIVLSTGPQWTTSKTIAQYVTSVSDDSAAQTYGGRYLFGALDQKQLTMTTRVSVIFTPQLSLQVFAQPLLAAGDYTHFKDLARPRTFEFNEYDAARLSFNAIDKSYTVDPDGTEGAAPSFTFDDPDFNLKSIRVNAVFRWELKPGSTIYAVWTRLQEDSENSGRFTLGRDTRAMFAAPGDDVLLIKMAYWLGR